LEQATGEPGELTNTLRHIAETTQRFFAVDDCAIYTINPITGRFVEALTIEGDLVESKTLFKQTESEGVAQKVLQQGVLLVGQLEERSEDHSPFTLARDIQAFVGLPLYLKYSQKPSGVLYLGFKQPQHFTSGDCELFRLFAGQVSYILQETWLVRRYREVSRIGHEINQELATVDILFQKVRQHVAGILDSSYTLLLGIYLSPTSLFNIYVYEGGQTLIYKNLPPNGAIQYVVETQQTFFSANMSEERLPFQRTLAPGSARRESVIFVPLVLRGVSLGALSVQHPEPNSYSEEDRFILELLANHIALALYNIRLYDSLNRLNEAGQFLTQQLESVQVLQEIVDKIWQTTEADSVILYPYDPSLQHFILPPRVAGTLLDSTPLHSTFLRPDDIVVLALDYAKPIFARQAASIYTALQDELQEERVNFQQREQIQSVAVMPLRVGEVIVGVLFLNFRPAQHFDTPQKSLIEGLVHYAAIAIKNAQRFGALSQRRIRELEMLQHIDRELNRNLDLEPALNTLLEYANEQVPTDASAILLYDPQSQVLEAKAAIGRDAESRRLVTFSLHEAKGITRWVLEHKKPVRVRDVRNEPPWKDLYFEGTADTVSELDVPLLDEGEVIGVLNCERAAEDAFSEEDERLLITLAGQAILAIKKTQAYEREKRFAEEAQVLNEISKEITSQLNLTHVFDLIVEKALDLTHSMEGNLMLYDSDKNDLWMAAERNVAEDKKGLRQSLDQGVVGYVARHKELLNVDLSQSPWNEINTGLFPGARSELAVPMLAGSDLRGVLNVESSSPKSFNKSDEHLLQGLAGLAVIALQNAQAFDNEKRLAMEGQVLNEISREIATQLDPVYIFQLILKKALEVTGSAIGSLHLYDPNLHELHIAAEYGVSEEKKSYHQKPGEGIVGYAAAQQQLTNVADISQPPWNAMYLEFSPGVCSELAVPMLEGTTLRGVLNIESLEVGRFDARDERLLKGLADLAVVALQSMERYKKASREAQQTEMLYRAGRELARITDWEELDLAYDIILHIAEEHSLCQVVIRRYDDYSRELILIRASQYQRTPPFLRIELDEGLNGQVARERRTIMVHDTHNPPAGVALNLSDAAIRSLVITPVQFKDRYYGNLALAHRDAGYFRGSEASFFEGLADQLASTIYRLETAGTRQELEQISSIGHSAFELTHRLANDLGLVQFYTSDIQWRMGKLGVADDELLNEKLGEIEQSVRGVLIFSDKLKSELTKPAEEEPVLISAQELLEEAMAQSSLPSDISVSLKIDNGLEPIRIIRNQVIDILRNLIANAIDAMPSSGKISLQARNSGHFVALEITDTGIGIPAHQQSKIFDLSFSTKGSSGFGLWSARRNALRNRGELRVESQPGHTTFTLLLPRTDGGTV